MAYTKNDRAVASLRAFVVNRFAIRSVICECGANRHRGGDRTVNFFMALSF